MQQVWFTEEEVRRTGKKIYKQTLPPKWYLSRTLCKAAGAPVQPEEEPVGYKFNHTKRMYSALYDRTHLEMWKLPMYRPGEKRPEGIVAPAVASPRVRKDEKPVAYIHHIDSFTPLYDRRQ